MKHIFFLVLFSILSIESFSEQITIFYSGMSSTVRYIDENNNYQYTGNAIHQIGRSDGTNGLYTGSTQDIWRSYFYFDLLQIPSDAIINQAQLIVFKNSYDCSSCKVKVTKLSAGNTFWNDIDNNNVIVSDIIYSGGTYQQPLESLKNAIIGEMSSGTLYLGTLSQNESSNITYASIELRLIVDYTIPIYLVNLIAQNNFEFGTIKTAVNGTPIQRNSPYSFTANTNQTVNLEAQNQSYNGYARVWNNYMPVLMSGWQKRKDGVTIDIPNSSNNSYSFVPTTNENNSTYLAGLRKNYLINRINQTEFDGNPTATSYIVEQNSGQLSTQGNGYQPGSIVYNFAGWLDNSTMATTRTITPTDNQTYTALYKYPHHSNQNNAYSNTSQRRFIQTPDGVKHICYESMNRVWLEHSTDNGATWFLGNGGKPLSSADAKNPSMSFYGNQLGIVWQEKYGASFNIKLAIFYSANYSSSVFGTLVSDDGADYTLNANPVVEWGYNGKIVVVWSGSDLCIHLGSTIALKYWYGNATSNGISILSQCAIDGTDENSVNPTIIANYSVYANPFYFHFAWQQVVNTSTSKINYCKLYADANNNLLNSTI